MLVLRGFFYFIVLDSCFACFVLFCWVLFSSCYFAGCGWVEGGGGGGGGIWIFFYLFFLHFWRAGVCLFVCLFVVFIWDLLCFKFFLYSLHIIRSLRSPKQTRFKKNAI